MKFRVLAAALVAWLPVALAAAIPDTLEQKSVSSVLAQRSPLNALANAGGRLVTAGIRGHILYSDDQGGHWTQASVPVSVSLTGLCFADRSHGWAVGHRGVILGTDDGGQSWTRQLDGLQAAQAILAAERDDPVRVADAQRLVEEGADKPFLALQCLGGKRALAVGAYGLAFATEDGEHWQPLRGVLDGSEGHHLNAVERSGSQLFLAGELGGLMRLSDDLRDFSRLAQPYDGSFFGLLSSTSGTLLAFGLRGHLFRSDDHGANWRAIDLPTTKSLTAGVRLLDGGLLLADESGQGWLSRDDGRSFRAVEAQQSFPLVALLATADGGSLAVGSNGITRFLPGALR